MAAPPNPPAFIPPPPLPEFYLPRKAGKIQIDQERTPSSSSLSDEPDNARKQAVANDKTSRKQKHVTMGQYTYFPAQTHMNQILHVTEMAKEPPIPEDGTNERPRRIDVPRMMSTQFIALQPSVAMGTNNVPPLAIYHICRICLRPRSNRYHYEHPIPPNGVPPPPGICRRCRVRSVKESEVTEVEFRKESNEIKIGLQCIIPNAEYISFDEMKEWKRGRFLSAMDKAKCDEREATDDYHERDRLISCRHVRARSVSQTSSRQSLVQATLTEPNQPPITFRPNTTVVSTAQDAIDAVSEASVQAGATVKVSSKTALRPTPEQVESQIRKIAREEVERYRQAERKMEAHGDCYAHGRMVPVEPPRLAVPEETPDTEFEERISTKAKESRVPDESTEQRRQRVPEDQYLSHREKEDAHAARPSRRPDRVTRVIIKDRVTIDEPTQQREPERQRSVRQAPMSSPNLETHCPSAKVQNERSERSSGPKPTPVNREISYRRVRIPAEPLIPDHDVQIQKKPERDTQPAPQIEQTDDTWSGRTDQEYWYGDGDVLTASGISRLEESQKTYRGQATPSEVTRGPPSLSDRLVRSPELKQNISFYSRVDDAEESQHSTQTIRPGSQHVGDSWGAGVTSSPQRYGSRINDTKIEASSQREQSASTRRTTKVNDKEYFYASRTTEPVRHPARARAHDAGGGWTQVETTEFLRRRRRPAESEGVVPSRDKYRQEKEQGTGSDTSRVRFANKIEFSPTPPGSDASSTQFRQIGRQPRGQMDGYGGSEYGDDLIEEYEHRGRVRDRASTTGRREFYVKGTTEHERETWEVESRPLARALSESPSREQLNAIASQESKTGSYGSKSSRQVDEWTQRSNEASRRWDEDEAMKSERGSKRDEVAW